MTSIMKDLKNNFVDINSTIYYLIEIVYTDLFTLLYKYNCVYIKYVFQIF